MELWDFEDIIGKLPPCLEIYVRAAQKEKYRRRRDAIGRFFLYYACYSANLALGTGILRTFVNIDTLFDKAIDEMEETLTPDKSPDCDVYHELFAVREQLDQGYLRVYGAWDRGDLQTAAAEAQRTLSDIFSWDRIDFMRAYIYACTQECLTKEIRDQERFKMRNAIGQCLLERKNDQ